MKTDYMSDQIVITTILTQHIDQFEQSSGTDCKTD